MTVHELLRELEDLDPDYTIFIESEEGIFRLLDEVAVAEAEDEDSELKEAVVLR